MCAYNLVNEYVFFSLAKMGKVLAKEKTLALILNSIFLKTKGIHFLVCPVGLSQKNKISFKSLSI